MPRASRHYTIRELESKRAGNVRQVSTFTNCKTSVRTLRNDIQNAAQERHHITAEDKPPTDAQPRHPVDELAEEGQERELDREDSQPARSTVLIDDSLIPRDHLHGVCICW